MRLRAALAAPFRLAPIDLLTAIVIAVIGLSIVAGPVFSQEAGPSPAPSFSQAPTDGPATEAPGTAAPTAEPSPVASATAEPASTAAPTTAPSQAGSAEPSLAATLAPDASAAPGASPTLAPGANSFEDPCAPRPTPTPTPTPDPDASPTPSPDPNASPTPAPSPLPENLCPAQPGANPLDLLATLFTPIFQAIFLGLVLLYNLTGDIGIAIVLLTILIRILLIPVFRAQIVSQRRMQMLQPELRAIQTKYKGDRQKISQEQMQLYRDRGVNPASGCLPALIQLVLLLPMYQVFNRGLNAPDISAMLNTPLGTVDVTCYNPTDPYAPCIDPNVWWLAWIPTIEDGGFHFPGYPGGLPANVPEIFLSLPFLFGFGLSLLALTSAVLQLIQTRMMMNRSAVQDSQQATQQRLFLFLPAFSLIYGFILPAGLFIYWITTTVFSIIQQFLINGYGGLFPLFGWTPGFAKDHQPRFPVSLPEPKPAEAETKDGKTTKTKKRSTKDSAAGTIRPARRRSRRRGRRR